MKIAQAKNFEIVYFMYMCLYIYVYISLLHSSLFANYVKYSLLECLAEMLNDIPTKANSWKMS